MSVQPLNRAKDVLVVKRFHFISSFVKYAYCRPADLVRPKTLSAYKTSIFRGLTTHIFVKHCNQTINKTMEYNKQEIMEAAVREMIGSVLLHKCYGEAYDLVFVHIHIFKNLNPSCLQTIVLPFINSDSLIIFKK